MRLPLWSDEPDDSDLYLESGCSTGRNGPMEADKGEFQRGGGYWDAGEGSRTELRMMNHRWDGKQVGLGLGGEGGQVWRLSCL